MPGLLSSHDLRIQDTSGTPSMGFMLIKEAGHRVYELQDYRTIAPRVLTQAEFTQAELPAEVEAIWYQENWQAGMGLVNHRLGNGSVGIAEGYKIDTTSPSGIIRLARQLQASTVDSNPDEYKATGFAMVGTESWAFIGRDVYSWDYTNKNWDLGTEPLAVARVYRNGVNYGGNTYVPAWAEDAGSGGLYTGSDLPTPYLYKADADAAWTLSTLGPTAFDAARFMCKADDKLWAGYLAAYTDSTLNIGLPVFDAAVAAQAATSSTVTFAHTVAANADRCLIVVAAWEDVAPTTITGVTYNGVAMTQVGSTQSTGDLRAALFRLIAPATGSNNVVVTLGASQATIKAGAASFYGVYQTTPVGSLVAATGSSTTPSVGVSSVSGDMVIGAVFQNSNGSYTPGAGQTNRFENSTADNQLDGDTEAATGATTTISATLGGSTSWIALGVAVKPGIAAATTTMYLSADPTGTIAAGNVLRIEAEYVLCTAIAASPPSLTVVRGYRGTLGAAHSGVDVYSVALNKHHVRSSSDGTNTGSWSAATTIGTSDAEITSILPYYNGTVELLLVLKTDGLWTLTAAGTLVHLYDLQAEQHSDNGRGAFAWDGNRRIIIPKGSGGMWELFEGEVRDISFSLVMPAQTQLHGKVVAGASDSSFCFVLVQDTTNLKYHMMMGELVSIGGTTDYRWHHVAAVTYTTGTTAAQCAVFACGVPSGANVHHRIQVGISSSGSSLLPYFYTLTGDTEDRYTGDDNGYAITVKGDWGHPVANKRLGKVAFTTANLGSGGTDHYFEVKYRVDGGSWTYVTGAQAGSTLTTSPQTLTFAAEVTGKVLEYQLLPFQGTTTTTGPEILDIRTTAQLRLDTIDMLPCQVYLAAGQRLLNGAMESLGVAARLAQLETWHDQAAEVTVIDARGTSRSMVFLKGSFRCREVANRYLREPEYVIGFVLAAV